MSDAEDPISFLFRIGLGPWLTPVRGKVAMLDAWQKQPPVEETDVRMWLSHGLNIAIRTGSRPGILLIDNDQPRKPEWPSDFVLPPTELIVLSPTGSQHGYYRHRGPWPKNSSSVLAVNVDIKSENGYAVLPPSIHPITRTAYVWLKAGEPGHVPIDVLAFLMAPSVNVDMTSTNHDAPTSRGTGYAETALVRETARVRAAPEGTRNETLNRAAYNLGQLVAGGALPESTVRADLASAAAISGLSEREVSKTIDSGLRGGATKPRGVPDRPTSARTTPTTPHEKSDVLVPGSFVVPGGEYIEQGNDTFAAGVLAALDPAALYRRAGAVGEIHDGQFASISSDRMRSIVDASMRLRSTKKTDDEITLCYRTCSRDNAAVVLDYASVRGDIRDLRYIATHPVCTGPEFKLARPGWNAESGVFQTCLIDAIALDLQSARAVLEDLICDFPFATPADRANYIGLMLTVVLRPAIAEPVPMHLIGSPVERTGKTKLAEIVLGCGVLGRPTPAMQIGVREEEREKRITAALLAGDSVIHLDNLHDFVDSAALASLLTSSVYRGRELGHTRLLALPNGVTIVGTGNNIHATGEISKRVVPIMLQPATDAPETRQDYRHPLLRSYVESQRPRVLGALLGLVEAWRTAGRPLGNVGFGGFERWSAVIGGIMTCAGYPEWCANLISWRGSTDDFSAELKAFVDLWATNYEMGWVATSELFKLAETNQFFDRKLCQTTERGRQTAFGLRVISAAANRMVGLWRVEVEGEGARRRARLV